LAVVAASYVPTRAAERAFLIDSSGGIADIDQIWYSRITKPLGIAVKTALRDNRKVVGKSPPLVGFLHYSPAMITERH
jgi:hypothetical protein